MKITIHRLQILEYEPTKEFSDCFEVKHLDLASQLNKGSHQSEFLHLLHFENLSDQISK